VPLVAADECRHEPQPQPNWQENYMFLGWDEDHNTGIYLHLGHLPDRGVVDARILVSIGGRVCSAAKEFAVEECLAVPWVQADIVAPLDRWRLKSAAKGREGYGSGGWLAAGNEIGNVECGFDIEFEGVVQTVDYADLWPQMGVENIFTHHYEAGCRWKGTVTLGGESIACAGSLIRDHSWGPRDLKNAVDLAWWFPMVADDGSRFITGTSLLRDGAWVGFMMEESGDGPKLISTDPWLRPDGLAVPSGFDSATLLCQRDGAGERVYRYHARLHAPVYYETMGSHQLDDIFSRVELPSGGMAFGNLELNLPRGRR
jgi:hypothetical protein